MIIARKSILIVALFSFTCLTINAQEKEYVPLKVKRNYIIANASFLNFNFNYERNIINNPKFLTNIRIGYGKFNDLQGSSHEYSAALVELIGLKNSHLELNLGLKKFKADKNNANPSSSSLMVDGFVGYRYEKPDGVFIFRAGLFYPSIASLTLGIGFKF